MINKELAHLIFMVILFLIVLSTLLFIPKLVEISQNKSYIKNALNEKDYSYCEKISKESSKEDCYYQLAIAVKNKDYCQKSGDIKKCLSLINQN